MTPQQLVSIHSHDRLTHAQLKTHLDSDPALHDAMRAEHQRCAAVVKARSGRNCWIETRGHKALTELLNMAGRT